MGLRAETTKTVSMKCSQVSRIGGFIGFCFCSPFSMQQSNAISRSMAECELEKCRTFKEIKKSLLSIKSTISSE